MKTNFAKQWSLTLYLGLLALLLWTVSVRAQAPAQVWLTGPTADITAGETFDVMMEISGATDLFAAEIALGFDPMQLHVVDADGGQDGIQVLPASFLNPEQGFVVVNRADNDAGTVLYALTLLAPSSPVDGAGQLAMVTFRAVGSGETTVELEHVLLATRDGTALSADIADNLTVRISNEAPITMPGSPVSSTPPSSNPDLPASSTSPVLPHVTFWTADHLTALAVCLGAGGLLLLGFGLAAWLRKERRLGESS